MKAVLETALTEADAPLVVADLKRDTKRDTGRPRTVGAMYNLLLSQINTMVLDFLARIYTSIYELTLRACLLVLIIVDTDVYCCVVFLFARTTHSCNVLVGTYYGMYRCVLLRCGT